MVNKEAAEILNLLYQLAIKSPNTAITIDNDKTFMAASVEIINLAPWKLRHGTEIIDGDKISVCHYGEQNGDLMRDPEMIFEKSGNTWIPTYFRNDYVGVEQLYPTEKQKLDMADFADIWMKNIKQQQNL